MDEATAVTASKPERNAEPEAAPHKSEQVAAGSGSPPGQEDYWFYLDPSNKEQVCSHIISNPSLLTGDVLPISRVARVGSADQCQVGLAGACLCSCCLHAWHLLA